MRRGRQGLTRTTWRCRATGADQTAGTIAAMTSSRNFPMATIFLVFFLYFELLTFRIFVTCFFFVVCENGGKSQDIYIGGPDISCDRL